MFVKTAPSASLLAITLAGLTACGPKPAAESTTTASSAIEEDTSSLTGTFTADGTSHTGKVSTQKVNVTGQFSVVCQDDNFGFVQITFANEDDARKPQNLKLVKLPGTKANDVGTVNVSLSPFSGNELSTKDESPGTVTVTKEGSHNVVSFESVEVGSITSDAKKALTGKVTY